MKIKRVEHIAIAVTSLKQSIDLLRDTFGPDTSDRDALLLFTIIHCCNVEVTGSVLKDRPSVKAGGRVEGITQRHCATALASLWKGTQDERARYTYWYFRWNGEWGSYGHVDALSREEVARLTELKGQLEKHPFVSRIIDEDDFGLFETGK